MVDNVEVWVQSKVHGVKFEDFKRKSTQYTMYCLFEKSGQRVRYIHSFIASKPNKRIYIRLGKESQAVRSVQPNFHAVARNVITPSFVCYRLLGWERRKMKKIKKNLEMGSAAGSAMSSWLSRFFSIPHNRVHEFKTIYEISYGSTARYTSSSHVHLTTPLFFL
jgi:hypothetical protein